SREEIQEEVDSIVEREDVFQDEVEVSENEILTFYRYPPAEDSEYKETAQFLAELTFYYADNNLMFSSITPGYYSVEMDNLPTANDLMTLMTVSEIENLNPKVYTISEMQINDDKIQQVMIPAMNVNEEGSEELLAFYFFTRDENIIQYAYLPFSMVSQDFPTNSILLFYQLIPKIENLLSSKKITCNLIIYTKYTIVIITFVYFYIFLKNIKEKQLFFHNFLKLILIIKL